MHFRKILLIIILVCWGCASWSRDPAGNFTANQLQSMGEKFLAARDYGQALKYLTLAEEKRPKDPTIQYSLGLAYYERGLKFDAYTHLKRALALKPDYAEAENALGRYYAEQGQLDLAQLSFEKAIANPFYSTPHFALYNLGLIYEKKGDLNSALKQYQEAVRIQPGYGIAYFQMGQVLEQLRRGDEARQSYGKAIEYSPDLVAAHYRYGVMSYTAGELENALYSFNRVVKLAPDSEMAAEASRYLERLQSLLPKGSVPKTSMSAGSVEQVDIIRNRELLDQQVAAVVRDERKGENQSSAASRHYIVQLGSFLDKDNAEDLQKKLERKGYTTVIKPYKHQVLGDLYVVQLKPVEDADKATMLMLQVEREGHGSAIIIEVPAN